MFPSIPSWFYQSVSIICFWLGGQVLVEWLKIKMRSGSGDRRSSSGLLIDNEVIKQIIGAFEHHTKVVQDMLGESREHRRETEKVLKIVEKIEDKVSA